MELNNDALPQTLKWGEQYPYFKRVVRKLSGIALRTIGLAKVLQPWRLSKPSEGNMLLWKWELNVQMNGDHSATKSSLMNHKNVKYILLSNKKLKLNYKSKCKLGLISRVRKSKLGSNW